MGFIVNGKCSQQNRDVIFLLCLYRQKVACIHSRIASLDNYFFGLKNFAFSPHFFGSGRTFIAGGKFLNALHFAPIGLKYLQSLQNLSDSTFIFIVFMNASIRFLLKIVRIFLIVNV
jgi:hypothetical protein